MKFWDIFHSFSVERRNSTLLRLVRFNHHYTYNSCISRISLSARAITYTYMLSSKYRFGQSMDCLHKVWILTLSGQSMDCLLNPRIIHTYVTRYEKIDHLQKLLNSRYNSPVSLWHTTCRCVRQLVSFRPIGVSSSATLKMATLPYKKRLASNLIIRSTRSKLRKPSTLPE